MRLRGPAKPILLLVVAGAIALSGCGGNDDGEAFTEPTSAFTATTPSPLAAETDQRLPPPQHPKEIDRTQQEIDRQEAVQREAQRQEAEFTRTPYEKAVERLPLHEPPLYGNQVVLDGTHQLVVSADTKRSFCGHSASERRAAVEAFYDTGEALMRREKINDFSLIVIPMDASLARANHLAVGRSGAVRLTARGRTAELC